MHTVMVKLNLKINYQYLVYSLLQIPGSGPSQLLPRVIRFGHASTSPSQIPTLILYLTPSTFRLKEDDRRVV